MRVFFIRHGAAAEPGSFPDDGERPLTTKGREETARVAKRLVKLGVAFDRLLASPLVRARETAEILQAAGLAERVEEAAFLAREYRVEALADELEVWRRAGGGDLALVGHEPTLSRWAETLVWGDCRDKLALRKAGIIAVELPPSGHLVGRCALLWLTSPKLL